MVFIYIVHLNQGKYYVGKTDNPKFRLDSHFKNGGCAWTKKYKPQQIIALFPDCDDFDENKYTLKYMAKYGDRNVRGGTYCRITLTEDDKRQRHNESNLKCYFNNHEYYKEKKQNIFSIKKNET